MKVFAYSVVDSDGYFDGSHSSLYLFSDRDKRDKAMMKDFKSTVRQIKKGGDTVEYTDEEPPVLLIQMSDKHITFEQKDLEVLE